MPFLPSDHSNVTRSIWCQSVMMGLLRVSHNTTNKIRRTCISNELSRTSSQRHMHLKTWISRSYHAAAVWSATETRGWCNIYDIRPKLKSHQILFFHKIFVSCRNILRFLYRARQYHCNVLCKISNRFDSREISSWRSRLRESCV